MHVCALYVCFGFQFYCVMASKVNRVKVLEVIFGFCLFKKTLLTFKFNFRNMEL